MWQHRNLQLSICNKKTLQLKFTTFQCKTFKLTCDDIEIYNFQFVILKLYNLNLQLLNVKVLNIFYKTLEFTTFIFLF
jgi:hypothetical protein